MAAEIYGWATAVLGLLSIAALAWYSGRPNTAREDEDAARAFFDAHGHWPGEPPPDEEPPA